MGELITRAEYMRSSGELHQAYFIQFATAETRQVVKRVIGEAAIVASKDPHFNDIPLRWWDALEPMIRTSSDRQLRDAAGEGWSLGTAVCIAKAVAREIREAHDRKVAGWEAA